MVHFIRSYYERTGKGPSRLEVCAELGLTKKRFYELFPGIMKTTYRVSGLPESADPRAWCGPPPVGSPRASVVIRFVSVGSFECFTLSGKHPLVLVIPRIVD